MTIWTGPQLSSFSKTTRRLPVPEAVISVRVQPGAKHDEIKGLVEGVLRVRVSSPARDGKANQALVKLLSDALGVSKNHVRVTKGHKSREKTVTVSGMERDDVLLRLISA